MLCVSPAQPVLLFQSEKVLGDWQLHMEDGHEGVKHLRGNLVVNMGILFVIHFFRTVFENTISKLFDILLVTLSILEIRNNFLRVSAFFYWFLGKLVNGILDILDLDVSVKRHIAHHDSDILGSDEAVIIKIVHVKREPHLGI